MKHYKLRYVMHDPSEETEDKYMAEIPALPGCRAWGDTPEDALDILQGVAAAFIESYIDHGDELPPAVASDDVSHQDRLLCRGQGYPRSGAIIDRR